jgi:hypothetical protein
MPSVAKVNRAQDGRQHANIRFRPGDNQSVRFALSQMREQLWLGEAGIACLVDDRCRRAKGRQRRHELQYPNRSKRASEARAERYLERWPVSKRVNGPKAHLR